MIAEINTTCVKHGKLETRYCPQCDSEAGIDRDPFTSLEVTPEVRKARVRDALSGAGLSSAQIDLVLSTLDTGQVPGQPSVSDDQLQRVLASLQGKASTAEAVQQEVMPVAGAP